MDRGVLNSQGTVVDPALVHPTLDSNEQWADLDRRGNWLDYRWAKQDGSGATLFLQTREANGVNEYTTVDPGGPLSEGDIRDSHQLIPEK